MTMTILTPMESARLAEQRTEYAEARALAAETALRELLVAVKYAAPPKNYGTESDPNHCYEARIPDTFVENAERALAAAMKAAT